MPEERPDQVRLASCPDDERVWWTRLRREAERRGNEGAKLMGDWSHDMIQVQAAPLDELVDGHWQPTPPERCTDEYKQAETRRLTDELGVKLGVGPMP